MPEAQQAAEDAGGAGAGNMVGNVVRMVVIYMMVQQFKGGMKGPAPAATDGVANNGGVGDLGMQVPAGGGGGGHHSAALTPSGQHKVHLSNAWAPRQEMDLFVYVTESEYFSDFGDARALVWQERGLSYLRDGSVDRERNVTLRASPALRRNETSLWMHVFVSLAGTSPDPAAPSHQPLGTAAAHHPLIKQVTRKIPKATRNLLSGTAAEKQAAAESQLSAAAEGSMVEKGGAEAGGTEVVPHFKPSLIISIVEDFSAFPPGGIPPQIAPVLTVDVDRGRYMPVLFINEFWCSNERLIAINETAASPEELVLELSFSVTNLMRWMLTAQMMQSLETQATMHGDATVEEMRRMLTETSPWLLGVTMLVSCLHTLFDVLAFKNDISFWKNNKSMAGLSFRSMIINLFFQTVIFLYLLDNDTSWMILFSNGTGLVIELWKTRKAVKSVTFTTPEGARFPQLKVTPADSYTFSETKMYDEEAMAYLWLAIYPLIGGYSFYSLAYEDHKSWYSWLLGSTVHFVYSFGFVLMTPQLFINYKLKSTAHMPWKTLMYKSLNTFIDDLFAFIIKMPTMHRLACLRDDLIFFIYLYQRYVYGVDAKRANEYGQVAADEPPADGVEQIAEHTPSVQELPEPVSATPALAQ